MECRANCGMCCIAPSITQSIPGMPQGKAAGVPCVNLEPDTYACRIWGADNYPDFCRGFLPDRDFCGDTREQAEQILIFLEGSTKP
ncbi:MAG: YkgJ family cysteine cluster protein [Pseudomonadota bacterium]|nr:YkgJ family cysteine cluster protein [Pseudomonadota bacterium]